jgi:mannobiose 2-epimerase
MLVDHTLAFGWNAETGQLFDRGWAFEPAFDRSVQWWALYEAMNAMLLMHERHGATTPAYWEAFEKTWRFTRETLTDGEHGGVYLGLDEHGTLRTEKSGNWFASYHQARALLLSIERLRRLAAGWGRGQTP